MKKIIDNLEELRKTLKTTSKTLINSKICLSINNETIFAQNLVSSRPSLPYPFII